MKEVEKNFGVKHVIAPAIGFLVLVRPEYVRLLRPDFNKTVNMTEAEAIVKVELARKILLDQNTISVHIGDYEQIINDITPEQRIIVEQNLISFDKFRKCGFPKIDKGFLEFLMKDYGKASLRGIQAPGQIQESDLTVLADERNLTAYLFPHDEKNVNEFFLCLDNLKRLGIPFGPKTLRRLAELYGVDGLPEVQELLKLFAKTNEDKGIDPDSLDKAIAHTKGELQRRDQKAQELEKKKAQEAEDRRRKEQEEKAEAERKAQIEKQLELERLQKAEEEKLESARKRAQDEADRKEKELLDSERKKREEQLKAEEEARKERERIENELKKKEQDRIKKKKEEEEARLAEEKRKEEEAQRIKDELENMRKKKELEDKLKKQKEDEERLAQEKREAEENARRLQEENKRRQEAEKAMQEKEKLEREAAGKEKKLRERFIDEYANLTKTKTNETRRSSYTL